MLITWNSLFELTPTNATYLKDVDDAILATKKAVKERVAVEHTFETKLDEDFDVYDQGYHQAGSSRVWARATEPAYMQPESEEVALGAGQAGEVWLKGDVDSREVVPYVFSGSAWVELVESTVQQNLGTINEWGEMYDFLAPYLPYDSSLGGGSEDQPLLPLHGYIKEIYSFPDNIYNYYDLIWAWRYSETIIKVYAFLYRRYDSDTLASPYTSLGVTTLSLYSGMPSAVFDGYNATNFATTFQRTT